MSKRAFFATLIGLALVLVAAWGPASMWRAHALENTVNRAIMSREVFVSPAEVATLMQNRQIALALLDLRKEAAFNWFHILDSQRISPEEASRVSALPAKTVKILIADDERVATEAYRVVSLSGTKQVYILAGGTAAWLALFGDEASKSLKGGALGAEHAASDPTHRIAPLPAFAPRVKLGAAGAKKSGGCGG